MTLSHLLLTITFYIWVFSFQIYLITDNISGSVDNFRKAVALDPDFPVTVVQHNYAEYKFAQMLHKTDDMLHYLNEFKNIISRFPDNVECITLYAQVSFAE